MPTSSKKLPANPKRNPIYRAGIIGCGNIAGFMNDKPEIRTHAAMFNASSKTKLSAVSEVDSKQLQRFNARWKVKETFSNYKQMLDQANLDIVSICTPPFSHYEILKELIRRKVKMIICEKPLADSLKKADELVKLCKAKKTVVTVNYWRRWDPFHKKVKNLIDQNKLGKIQTVDCYYTNGLANNGSHLFDLLRFFFGEAKWVWATSGSEFPPHDPSLNGYALFEKNVACHIHGLDARDYLMFEMDIYGTKGRIKIRNSGYSGEYWSVAESNFFPGAKEIKERKIPFSALPKHMMELGLQNLIDAYRNKSKIECSVEDGQKSLELICAMRLSKQKNKKITLPLKNRNISIS